MFFFQCIYAFQRTLNNNHNNNINSRITNAANTQPHNAAGAPRLPMASSRDPRIDIRVKNLRGIGETDDLDVRLTHLDSLSYVRSTKTVEQLFEDHHIKPKKDMYEEGCRQLRHASLRTICCLYRWCIERARQRYRPTPSYQDCREVMKGRAGAEECRYSTHTC